MALIGDEHQLVGVDWDTDSLVMATPQPIASSLESARLLAVRGATSVGVEHEFLDLGFRTLQEVERANGDKRSDPDADIANCETLVEVTLTTATETSDPFRSVTNAIDRLPATCKSNYAPIREYLSLPDDRSSNAWWATIGTLLDHARAGDSHAARLSGLALGVANDGTYAELGAALQGVTVSNGKPRRRVTAAALARGRLPVAAQSVGGRALRVHSGNPQTHWLRGVSLAARAIHPEDYREALFHFLVAERLWAQATDLPVNEHLAVTRARIASQMDDAELLELLERVQDWQPVAKSHPSPAPVSPRDVSGRWRSRLRFVDEVATIYAPGSNVGSQFLVDAEFAFAQELHASGRYDQAASTVLEALASWLELTDGSPFDAAHSARLEEILSLSRRWTSPAVDSMLDCAWSLICWREPPRSPGRGTPRR